jgi:hypothetical protein
MALTADRNYETSGLTEKLRVLLTASDIYYKGAIVVFTAAGGLAIVASDTAALGKLAGVMVKHVEPGAATDVYAEIEVGKIWIPFSGAAQADVGDYVYATADDTIAKTATNSDPIGLIVDVRVGVAALVDFRKGITKTALA